MYRKIILTGVTAAAIVGAGGTALALTGSDTPSAPATGSSSTATHAKHAGKHDGKGKHGTFRRLEHGQFVTKGKGGTFVTRDVIRGTVTAVSATSITVQSADKKSETFAVNGSTKVHTRTAGKKGKPATSTIGAVKTGDRAAVLGTGASSYTATRVVDVKGTKAAK